MKIWINGEFMEKDDAKISVFDHGVLYGDGVFEGIRAYAGTVFKLKDHIDRLYESAKVIKLKIPYENEEMCSFVKESLKENNLQDAYFRLIVTRGEGDLGLSPLKCPKPNVIIITDKIALYPQELYEKGLSIITARKIKVSNNSIPPLVKSTNYLKNILAKMEGIEKGVEEVLMLNEQGNVAECSADNIFIINKKGEILTPDKESGILNGVTRNTVMNLAKENNYPIAETKISLDEVYNASEVFLTGTAAEIISVVKVDDQKIGEGIPGKITLDLAEKFKNLTLR